MSFPFRLLLLFSSISLLVSCGGGSSSTSDSKVVGKDSSFSKMIGNSQDYDSSELKTSALKLIKSKYTGISSEADIDIDLAQQVFLSLFQDSTLETPEIGDGIFSGQVNNGDIDLSIDCYYHGSVVYRGKLDSELKGNVSLTYNNCLQENNDFPITGSVAISIVELTEFKIDLTYYFDELSWQYNGESIKLTGVSELTSSINRSGQIKISNAQNVLYVIDEIEQILIDGTMAINEQVYQAPIEFFGDIYIGLEGKVGFSVENIYDISPYTYSGTVFLEGKKSVALEFVSSPYIRYVEDTDNDDVYDKGTFFSGLDELFNGDVSGKKVVALEALSLPPSAYSPRQEYNKTYDTTTPIEVNPGAYHDPDTPEESLEISYRWYVNNFVIENQQSNILAPNTAVFGDEIKVTMLVSDGSSVVESPPIFIHLEDAPTEIKVLNIPSIINSGDLIEFSVQVSDPDYGNTELIASLISAPDGVEIDDEGLVSWNVPSDLLFPYQNYEFVFGIVNEDETASTQLVVPIKVESNKTFPVARSGIEVPKSNKSMYVGDFDGDGENEVLSTDSRTSIFLLEFHENSYRQKWVYPFKVASEGKVIQVLPANIDDDDTLEIIVVTANGVSIINGLNNIATLLFSTDNYISFATIKDVDGDGILELAYLYSTSDSYGSDKHVNVISIDSPEESLFSTNLSAANQIEFANVDNDTSFELVSNNGLVYDVDTWVNQWFSGNQFGNRSVTTGDYDGDGVAEIAGADTWGNITVYSAVDKAQLDSFDNFNTCTMHSADVDADGADELLVGDCQWGSITAYKLVNNTLTSLWSVDMKGHGSVSLTSGDSDNDGKMELHWGSGISSSGQDSFVSADINGSSAVIKEDATFLQLDSYSSAGWANLTDFEERAVFYIPSTASGYNGSRIVTLDREGKYDLSDEISSNWDNSSYSVTTDFNNDGFGDIFLPNTNLYDGSFSAVQLNDGITHWETSGDYDSNIGLIKAVDFNADGFEDAVYADSRILKAIDVYNQSIIANYTFDFYIEDFVALIINDVPTAIVSSGSKLMYLTANDSVFSEQSFIEQSCASIELINYDEDEALELLCLQGTSSYQSQKLVIFELNGLTLLESSRSEIDYGIIDVSVDPSKEKNQDLFLTVQSGDTYSYWDDNNLYQIKKSTSTGLIIWSSPSLVGKPTNHGLKVRKTAESGVEMMLSTSSMMYWIH